jgi:hypothetical protein
MAAHQNVASDNSILAVNNDLIYFAVKIHGIHSDTPSRQNTDLLYRIDAYSCQGEGPSLELIPLMIIMNIAYASFQNEVWMKVSSI